MPFPTPVEKLGERLVRDVRDFQLKVLLEILTGESRAKGDKILSEKLKELGITSTEAQREALRKLLVNAVDLAIGETLSFFEYHITVGNLDVVVRDRESGESYRIKDTDMIAAEYSSGKGTWVDKYGEVRE